MGLSLFDERVPVVRNLIVPDTSTPSNGILINPSTLVTRVDNVLVSTDNTVDIDVTLWLFDDASINVPVATVTVPAGSGTVNGVPSVDLLATVPMAQAGLILGPNCAIGFNMPVALVVGKQITFSVLGGSV